MGGSGRRGSAGEEGMWFITLSLSILLLFYFITLPLLFLLLSFSSRVSSTSISSVYSPSSAGSLVTVRPYLYLVHRITQIVCADFAWLYGDLVAGITVGIVLVPQSMSYAQIATLPVQFGLYSAFVGVFIYCVSPSPTFYVITLHSLVISSSLPPARMSPSVLSLSCP